MGRRVKILSKSKYTETDIKTGMEDSKARQEENGAKHEGKTCTAIKSLDDRGLCLSCVWIEASARQASFNTLNSTIGSNKKKKITFRSGSNPNKALQWQLIVFFILPTVPADQHCVLIISATVHHDTDLNWKSGLNSSKNNKLIFDNKKKKLLQP